MKQTVKPEQKTKTAQTAGPEQAAEKAHSKKKKHPHFRRFLRALLILFGIGAAVLLYFYISSLFLRVAHYTVQAKLGNPIRIVQLTDLHNTEFGKNNETLIEKVAEQQPDVIFITGDMLNEDDPNTEIVTHLVTELCKISPVYYGYGNHETGWEQAYKKDLHEILGAAGATVLESEYVDVEINGTVVRIGGYMGYWSQAHMFPKSAEQKEKEYQFFSDFRRKDLPNGEDTCRLVLNHIPTTWLDWHYIDQYDTGIVFSGHYHGGMIRVPILDRGLIAPYVGWWPPYTRGVFVGSKSTCILSAGLGTQYGLPRLNNPPEIVVVDLVPAQ